MAETDVTHTPEPWLWHAQGEASEYCLITHDNKWVIAFRINGEQTIARERANARRIVTCVNACKGIPNVDLEMDNSKFIAALNERGSLKEQRDQLLAAINLIVVDKDGDGFVCREGMEEIRGIVEQVTAEINEPVQP